MATLGPGNEVVNDLADPGASVGEALSLLPESLPEGGEEALDDLTSAMARLDAAVERSRSQFPPESPEGDEHRPRVTIWLVCATIPVVPRVVSVAA